MFDSSTRAGREEMSNQLYAMVNTAVADALARVLSLAQQHDFSVEETENLRGSLDALLRAAADEMENF